MFSNGASGCSIRCQLSRTIVTGISITPSTTRLQEVKVEFEEVALVALSKSSRSAEEGRGPTRHQLGGTKSPRAFAHLLFRLPSDSQAGSVLVKRDKRLVARHAAHSQFVALYTSAYSDCECTLLVEEPGHAVFIVYAVTLPQVCT